MIRIISRPRRPFAFSLLAALLLHVASGLGGAAYAWDLDRSEVQSFIEELTGEHGFQREALEQSLTDSSSQQKILDAISRPAERRLEWHEYRGIFLKPERILAGVDFWSEHAELLGRIAADTGVPESIIVAIIGVETYFGRNTGSWRVLDALTTLAFDYPPRSSFFRRELVEFFLLSREESLNLDSAKGSYAGAMGPPQFIPSSYRAYAVDGDGDGRRDLLSNWNDVIASVANYFVAHRWRSGERVFVQATATGQPTSKNRLALDDTLDSLAERGVTVPLDLPGSTRAALYDLAGKTNREYWVGFHNAYVITRYNRSVLYALAVYQLSEAIAAERAAITLAAPSASEG